jgi:hypothetical protein
MRTDPFARPGTVEVLGAAETGALLVASGSQMLGFVERHPATMSPAAPMRKQIRRRMKTITSQILCGHQT